MSTALAPGDRLDTLPPGNPEYTLGYWAIWWAESNLIQPNGPRAQKPFRFTQRQRRFLLWWYAVDAEGRWLFHHGVRRLAKGSGKSPFAAVLALIEFCGPVRLVHIDVAKADQRLAAWGWCVGQQVDMPLVQIAATAESQTANTMRMVRAFAPKGSAVVEKYQLDPGKTQYYRLPEGTLQVITSSATAAEGAEGSFTIGDETEHWRPSNGGEELASTLLDNLAKSGSRMLETSNAWKPGAETVAESSWDAWVAQEEGRTRGETSILYDAVIAPPDTDLADPASLRSALEFVYGDCEWRHGPDGRPDVRPIMERIWSPKAKPDDSKRKYLNRPTVAEDAWTTPEAWAVLADPTRVVEDGEDVVLFFDGSKSSDATALIGCCVEDGHVFTVDVWEPDPKDEGDVVPVSAVDLTVRRAPERWRVVGFYGDVREWESFVKVSWPEAFPDLEVQAVPSGKDPQAIAWDMRGHTYEFTMAAELALAEVEGQAFTHDGDSRVARHVANMRRRPNRWGVSVGKESPSSAKKVDAGVCVIGARMVRRLVLAERARNPGARKKKPGRVVSWG